MSKRKVKDTFIVRAMAYVDKGGKPHSEIRNHVAVLTTDGWMRMKAGYAKFFEARRKQRIVVDKGTIDTKHWVPVEVES